MQKRHIDSECYFNEQAKTTKKYYIPYIQSIQQDFPHDILEVGCGVGGNLLPFAEMGCNVIGVDIATSQIEHARELFSERGLKGTFIDSDIFKLKELQNSFSLIIIHDVIEHIGDKVEFLSKMKNYLSAGGFIFIAFPAWQMPFGGHQQIAKSSFISHLPFVHLLPFALYKGVLRLFGEDDAIRDELLSIKKTRCSIERFLRTIKRCDYHIVRQQLYFINPHYETKFHLKPRKLNKLVGKIPYLRDFFSTSCFYILSA